MRTLKIAAFCVGASVPIVFFHETRKIRKAEHEKYMEAVQEEVISIHRATAVVCDRIRRGEYNGKTIGQIHEDLEFETIAQMNRPY